MHSHCVQKLHPCQISVLFQLPIFTSCIVLKHIGINVDRGCDPPEIAGFLFATFKLPSKANILYPGSPGYCRDGVEWCIPYGGGVSALRENLPLQKLCPTYRIPPPCRPFRRKMTAS